MMEALVPIALIALFVAANGFFVASEFSVMLAPYPRIESREEAGHRQAPYVLTILRDKERRNDFIATSQIGITLASLALGMYAEERVAHWLHEVLHLPWLSEQAASTAALLIAVCSLSFLHVVVGEMVPQTIAVQMPERVVLAVAGTMRLCETILGPLAHQLNRAAEFLIVRSPIPIDQDLGLAYSKEEIQILIEESYHADHIEDDEFGYLERIGNFDDHTVNEVMTPRTRVVGIREDATYAEVIEVMREAGLSRYPIYGSNLDDIKGILHFKQLARLDRSTEFRLVDIITRVPDGDQNQETGALVVPGSTPLPQMLKLFQSRGAYMAVVQDEFQGTAGLVTLEDLMEEIFGEIEDESDLETNRAREAPRLEIRSGTTVVARLDVPVDELPEDFAEALGETKGEAETISGMIMNAIDRVPTRGDETRLGEVSVRVEGEPPDLLALLKLSPSKPSGN